MVQHRSAGGIKEVLRHVAFRWKVCKSVHHSTHVAEASVSLQFHLHVRAPHLPNGVGNAKANRRAADGDSTLVVGLKSSVIRGPPLYNSVFRRSSNALCGESKPLVLGSVIYYTPILLKGFGIPAI